MYYLLTQGYIYNKRRYLYSYSELLSKFGGILFQEYVSKGIASSLQQTKEVQRQREFHLVGFEKSKNAFAINSMTHW